MPFYIVFIAIPLLEIYVFAQVGDEIGLGMTLLLCLITAVIGGAIIKYQGFYTLQSMQNSVRQGIAPMAEIFDGFCLIAAGVALITPGFITDTLGFLLLLPPVRAYFRTKFGVHFARKEPPQSDAPNTGVIEGEYTRLDDEDDKRS